MKGKHSWLSYEKADRLKSRMAPGIFVLQALSKYGMERQKHNKKLSESSPESDCRKNMPKIEQQLKSLLTYLRICQYREAGGEFLQVIRESCRAINFSSNL